MANLVQKVNLELERSKAISDARLEAYREVKKGYDLIVEELGRLTPSVHLAQEKLSNRSDLYHHIDSIVASVSKINGITVTNKKLLGAGNSELPILGSILDGYHG